MSQQDERSFFDRLGEILNAPLPGTKAPKAQQTSERTEEISGQEDASLLERIKEILNTPLPGSGGSHGPSASADQEGTPQETGAGAGPAPSSAQEIPNAGTHAAGAPAHEDARTPDLDEDDLDEQWWKQDWAAFRAHQEQERQGLEQKQSVDLAKFAAYQDAEKRRFEAHQQQELNVFRQQQQWRLSAWKQAMAANPGGRPPPPPWGMPVPPGMVPPGGPPMGPSFPGPLSAPPWVGAPRPRRGR